MALARTYLDYNATAPLCDSAREAMLNVLGGPTNGSSVHTEGRNARRLIENARSILAKTVGAKTNQIVFTSGATEAAAHALCPTMRAGGRPVHVSKLYVAASEHPCVIAGGRFASKDVEILPVLESGLLDLSALEQKLSEHDQTQGAAMVATMLANNETGVIQPISEISKIVVEADAFLTVDAVQAFGRIEFDLASLGAHFVFVSSHKIGGPQGVGALLFGDASMSPQPMFNGGGQENFQRAGTENTAAIAGFGAAIEETQKQIENADNISSIRDEIETGIVTLCADAGNKAGEPVFFGREATRLPNTSCFAIPAIKAETALIGLDLEGIAISSGSACSSGKVKQSHVLKSMGVNSDLCECALRISTGYETSMQDAQKFLSAMKNIVSRIG